MATASPFSSFSFRSTALKMSGAGLDCSASSDEAVTSINVREDAWQDRNGRRAACHAPTNSLAYRTRLRVPSKLDPHLDAIEAWLAEQPQLTARAIVGRLSAKYPRGVRKRNSIRSCNVC